MDFLMEANLSLPPKILKNADPADLKTTVRTQNEQENHFNNPANYFHNNNNINDIQCVFNRFQYLRKSDRNP